MSDYVKVQIGGMFGYFCNRNNFGRNRGADYPQYDKG